MTLRERIREGLHRLPPKWRAVVLLSVLALGLVGGVFVVRTGRRLLGEWRLDARIARAETARADADRRAAAALAREQAAIEARQAVEVRAQAAEAALKQAQNLTVHVRQEYDETRNRDLSAVSADVVGLCTRLAELGYACRRRDAPLR